VEPTEVPLPIEVPPLTEVPPLPEHHLLLKLPTTVLPALPPQVVEVTEDPIPLKLEVVQTNVLLAQKLYTKTSKSKLVEEFGTRVVLNALSAAYLLT
jgi:hypothetical protein